MKDRFNWSVYCQADRDADMSATDQRSVTCMYCGLQIAIGNVLHRKSRRFYPNVPFSHSHFLKIMRRAHSILYKLGISKPKLLDVGCGLGTTLFLAEEENRFAAYGLDRNKKYLAIARELLRSEDRLIHANALKFNKYNEFDCIYWYNPIRNKHMSIKLEKRIVKQSKTPCVFALACDIYGNKEHLDVHLIDNSLRPATLYIKCTNEQWERLRVGIQ